MKNIPFSSLLLASMLLFNSIEASGQGSEVKLLDQAIQAALARNTFEMNLKADNGGVFVFYQNPSPFCYTFMIPGIWVARGQDSWASRDGKSRIDIWFETSDSLQEFAGSSLVERAGAKLLSSYRKASPVMSSSTDKLEDFSSSRPGTRKWSLAEVKAQDGKTIVTPPVYLVDFSPTAVANILVRVGDEDEFARKIIKNLRASDPGCYWDQLVGMTVTMFDTTSAHNLSDTSRWQRYADPSGWSIGYPDNWKVKSIDPSYTKLSWGMDPPLALVGIHTYPLISPSLDKFADSALAFEENFAKGNNQSWKLRSRSEGTFAGSVPYIDAIKELGPGGVSRSLFTIVNGRAIAVNAETTSTLWNLLRAEFDRVLLSFSAAESTRPK